MTTPELKTITAAEADRLDPAEYAPPILLDVDPTHDTIGHGRTLPLIGNSRQYLLDVTYADGAKRVYADTPSDAVAFVIGGEYPGLLAQARAFEAADPDDVDDDAFAQVRQQMLRARYIHADQSRIAAQARINEAARDSGAWDYLPTEEQDILQSAASSDGNPPVGVIATGYKIGDPDDAPMRDYGIWDAEVPLVLNTGDYEPFTNVPEPESALRYGATAGAYNGMMRPGDENLVRLVVWNGDTGNQDDDTVYLNSLHDAGLIEVVMRENDLPDDMFANVLRDMQSSS